MDADSGRVLASKNPDLQRPPASTTKIMTGLLLVEHCAPDDVIVAPLHVEDTKESSMHLEPGERVTAKNMLYALMLRSANDGCHAVAVHIAGSDAKFATMMNERAKQLGCLNTHFANPHGLNDPRHLTTARDLALIAREAMKHPRFAEAVHTEKKVIERSMNLEDRLMVNRDKWLRDDPRAIGIKTGWTIPAGHCFVGCARDGRMTVITVILDSPDWVADQKTLVDWSFMNFAPERVFRKGDFVTEATFADATKPHQRLYSSEDVWTIAPKKGGFDVGKGTLDLTITKAPVKAGTVVGRWTLEHDGVGFVGTDLIVDEDVTQRPFGAALFSPGGLFGFVVLSGGALYMRARSRRMGRGSLL